MSRRETPPSVKEEQDDEYASREPLTLSAETLNYIQTTTVDGGGMWKAWTRAFELPQDACLDLLDNCFDAALHPEGFHGRVIMSSLPGTYGGIYIMNNSKHKIKSLKDALTVYKSAKNNQADDDTSYRKDAIGENGVGLKHGCATLSDTSLVLTRNHNIVEFGVIAKCLQTSRGVCLPSFCFKVNNAESTTEIQDHLMNIMSANTHIGVVLTKELGNGDFTHAVDMLAKQCHRMWQGEWANEDHVFQVILCRYHHKTSATEVIDIDDERNPNDIFLSNMKERLPRYYMNVPRNTFSFKVNGEPVALTYWQHRLVELTRFDVNIPKEKSIENFEKLEENWFLEGHPLSVYCGFDTKRVKEQANGSGDVSCNLYFYSRQAGRLIMVERDARSALGLPHGGVDFMQGLTLIVDDIGSQLPLMPAKNGIGWSEQKGGEIHKQNLYSWVGGVARCYWVHHMSKFMPTDSKRNIAKELLRKTVMSFADADVQRIVDRMQDGRFTKFTGLKWWKQGKRIYTKKGKSNPLTIEVGEDTLMRFSDERRQQITAQIEEEEAERKAKLPPKRKASTAGEKRVQEQLAAENQPDRQRRDVAYSLPSKRQRGAASYRDESTSDENSDEETIPDRITSSAAAAAAATRNTASKKKKRSRRNSNGGQNSDETTTNGQSSNVRILELEAELAQQKLRTGRAESENAELTAEVQRLRRKLDQRDKEIKKLKQEKNQLILTGGSPIGIRQARVIGNDQVNNNTHGDGTMLDGESGDDSDDDSDDDGGGKMPATVTPNSNNEAFI